MPAQQHAREDNPREFVTDPSSTAILVDNGSSSTLWKDKKAFITYRKLSPAKADEITGSKGGILGLGGTQVRPIGIGTIRFRIEDDDCQVHTIKVERALHMPSNPINIFSPQQWVRQRNNFYEDYVAHVDTRGTYLLMDWSDTSTGETFHRYIPMSSSDVGIIYTAAEYEGFRSFAALFTSFNAAYVTDEEDANYEADADDDSETDDDNRSEAKNTDVPQSEGASSRSTPLQATFTTPNVIPPTKDDDVLLISDEKLKMEYHEKLGHLPFKQMDSLSKDGILPPKLAKIKSPKCPGCIYGKAHRKPWRTKAQPKSIKRATKPGEVVSVDQLQSPIPGFVPIAKGSPTNKRYTGATIFADHASGLTYVHLQYSLSTIETIEAKHAFE